MCGGNNRSDATFTTGNKKDIWRKRHNINTWVSRTTKLLFILFIRFKYHWKGDEQLKIKGNLITKIYGSLNYSYALIRWQPILVVSIKKLIMLASQSINWNIKTYSNFERSVAW